MAIIYSYPQKTTPAGNDFLVITDSEQPAPNKNRTKSLTVDNLANYVVTSTSGITGSGTLNTIAMFTPDGQSIGDSFITQEVFAPGTGSEESRITISNPSPGPGSNGNFLIVDTGRFTTVEADNILASDAGEVLMSGNVTIGNGTSDFLNINSTTNLFLTQIKAGPNAFGNFAPGENYVLASDNRNGLTSALSWKSYSESGATFLGWARYDGAASFSNGTEVTVTDGNFIDPSVSLVTNQIIDPYVNGLVGKFLFTSDDLNAVYSLTVVFKASAANANQTHVDVDFISGATDYERLSKAIGFYKGNNVVDNFHEMFQFYVDSDLITHGLQPRLYAQGGTVKFGDVIFFIQKQQQPAL